MNAGDDDPAADAIYKVGTLANVLQLLKLPDGTVKVLVEGASAPHIASYRDRTEFYEAEATVLVQEPANRSRSRRSRARWSTNSRTT